MCSCQRRWSQRSGSRLSVFSSGGASLNSWIEGPVDERRWIGETIRQTVPAVVEHENPKIGRQALVETPQKFFSPERFEVTQHRIDHDGRWAIAEFLIRDTDIVVRHHIPNLRNIHIHKLPATGTTCTRTQRHNMRCLVR